MNSIICNENLVAVHKITKQLVLNRPAYVGMCILDLSKTLMYDFHYNYIKSKYDKNAKLLFTDTDSLTYEIKTKDAYQDFFKDKHLFDSCEYAENSPLETVGKFKDETCGVPMTEFVGLRKKMYSYVTQNMYNGKTAKGIKNT